MIDTIAVSITIPYPTVGMLLAWVIIGALVVTGIGWFSVVTSKTKYNSKHIAWFTPVVMIVFYIAWPAIVYFYKNK